MMPRTTWGRWSLGCLVAFLVLFSVTRLLVPTGLLGEGGEAFVSNLAIAIPMFLSALLATVALITGAVSFIRRERSFLVVVSTLIGLLGDRLYSWLSPRTAELTLRAFSQARRCPSMRVRWVRVPFCLDPGRLGPGSAGSPRAWADYAPIARQTRSPSKSFLSPKGGRPYGPTGAHLQLV
jgi:hypothetical protein